MERLLKENILFILIAILTLLGGIFAAYTTASEALTNFSQVTEKKESVASKEMELEKIKQSKIDNEPKKKESTSGKVIYEVLGQQFSSEASFGIMFENILANITNSGVRIRSIDYNYSPADDKILNTNMPNYNACELSFTTVGTYMQFQNFFKNIAKEKYLSSIYEVYIEPYDKDKTILITKFKIRLYTKTI